MENINKTHTPINQWAEDERPREKMQQFGADSLSKAELLAILINHGNKSRSALDLARDLLKNCSNNLHQLARLSLADLQQVPGIGPAKAVVIKAAFELSIRKEADRIAFKKSVLNTATQAADFLRPMIQDAATENFIAIFLNQANRVLDVSTLTTGGITGTVVDVRTIARKALEVGATSIVVSHNHPSGSTEPSEADKYLTGRLQKGLATLEIKLIDHIIISDEGFYSFQESGNM